MTEKEKLDLMVNASLRKFENLPPVEKAAKAILHDINDRGFFDDCGHWVCDEMEEVFIEILKRSFGEQKS